jgi:hypothetical protein
MTRNTTCLPRLILLSYRKQFLQSLKFVVGKRDRSELMCIGGAYVTEDGADPASDPQTLINTAM